MVQVFGIYHQSPDFNIPSLTDSLGQPKPRLFVSSGVSILIEHVNALLI